MSIGLQPRDLWRQEATSTTVQECSAVALPTGALVINSSYTVIFNSSLPTFRAYCPDGVVPVSVRRGLNILDYLSSVDMNSTSFQVLRDLERAVNPFYKSSVPFFIVLGSVTFGIWLSSLAIWPAAFMKSQTTKFQVLVSIVSPICCTLVAIQCFKYTRVQYHQGYTSGYSLVNQVSSSNFIAISMLISNTVALLTQVRTAIRLVSRKKEQIFIFWTGITLITICQILWAFNIYEPGDPDLRTASADALIVFAYLFIVATSLLYFFLVLMYSLIKWRVAYKPEYLSLAIICIGACALPVILFLLDVSDRYVEGWDDICRLWSLMAAGPIVGKWVDKIEKYEAVLEERSILGRRTYTEDEAEAPPGVLVSVPSQGTQSDSDSSSDSCIYKYELDCGHTSPNNGDQPETKPDTWYSHLLLIPSILRQLVTKRPGTAASLTTYIITPNTIGDELQDGQIDHLRPPSIQSHPASTPSYEDVTASQYQTIIHLHPFRAKKKSQIFEDSRSV